MITDEQFKAIESLSRALRKCSRAGVKVIGMDSSLAACSETDLWESECENEFYRRHQGDVDMLIDLPSSCVGAVGMA